MCNNPISNNFTSLQDFQQLTWDCMSKNALLNGIHQFLDDSLVLPAGDWDEELLRPIIAQAHKKAVEVRRKSTHPQAMKSELILNSLSQPLRIVLLCLVLLWYPL